MKTPFKLSKERAQQIAAEQMNAVICLTKYVNAYLKELTANKDRVVGSAALHILNNFNNQTKFFLDKCKSTVPKSMHKDWDREYNNREISSLGDILILWNGMNDEQREVLSQIAGAIKKNEFQVEVKKSA